MIEIVLASAALVGSIGGVIYTVSNSRKKDTKINQITEKYKLDVADDIERYSALVKRIKDLELKVENLVKKNATDEEHRIKRVGNLNVSLLDKEDRLLALEKQIGKVHDYINLVMETFPELDRLQLERLWSKWSTSDLHEITKDRSVRDLANSIESNASIQESLVLELLEQPKKTDSKKEVAIKANKRPGRPPKIKKA